MQVAVQHVPCWQTNLTSHVKLHFGPEVAAVLQYMIAQYVVL